jgi:hypothetical protein
MILSILFYAISLVVLYWVIRAYATATAPDAGVTAFSPGYIHWPSRHSRPRRRQRPTCW